MRSRRWKSMHTELTSPCSIERPSRTPARQVSMDQLLQLGERCHKQAMAEIDFMEQTSSQFRELDWKIAQLEKAQSEWHRFKGGFLQFFGSAGVTLLGEAVAATSGGRGACGARVLLDGGSNMDSWVKAVGLSWASQRWCSNMLRFQLREKGSAGAPSVSQSGGATQSRDAAVGLS